MNAELNIKITDILEHLNDHPIDQDLVGGNELYEITIRRKGERVVLEEGQEFSLIIKSPDGGVPKVFSTDNYDEIIRVHRDLLDLWDNVSGNEILENPDNTMSLCTDKVVQWMVGVGISRLDDPTRPESIVLTKEAVELYYYQFMI